MITLYTFLYDIVEYAEDQVEKKQDPEPTPNNQKLKKQSNLHMPTKTDLTIPNANINESSNNMSQINKNI